MTTTMAPAFTYAAKVERVVDADTIDVELDLGMRVYFRTRLRVAHIDAPEVSTQEGKDARAFVAGLLDPGLATYRRVVVATHKPDKYGRALADVTYIDDDGWRQDLADILLELGYARPYEGGARS